MGSDASETAKDEARATSPEGLALVGEPPTRERDTLPDLGVAPGHRDSVRALRDELDQRVRLTRAWDRIGPEARETLCSIAERLAKGADEHGDFTYEASADYVRETQEEVWDALVYTERLLMRAARAARGRR